MTLELLKRRQIEEKIIFIGIKTLSFVVNGFFIALCVCVKIVWNIFDLWSVYNSRVFGLICVCPMTNSILPEHYAKKIIKKTIKSSEVASW